MPRDDEQCHHDTNPPKPNNIMNNINNKSLILSFILKPLVMCLLTSLFFLFLGLAALLLVLLLAAASLHRRHHRRHRLRRRPALRRLSQFRFPPTSPSPGASGDCVVCLEAFTPGQWCRALGGCGHVFHRRCVDAWLVKVPACPMCRTRVRLDYGDGVCHGLGDEDKWLWGSSVS